MNASNDLRVLAGSDFTLPSASFKMARDVLIWASTVFAFAQTRMRCSRPWSLGTDGIGGKVSEMKLFGIDANLLANSKN